MYYAYVRVSTDHQNVENQRHEIATYTDKHQIVIDKWFDETVFHDAEHKPVGLIDTDAPPSSQIMA